MATYQQIAEYTGHGTQRNVRVRYYENGDFIVSITSSEITYLDPNDLTKISTFNPFSNVVANRSTGALIKNDKLLVGTKSSGILIWDLVNDQVETVYNNHSGLVYDIVDTGNSDEVASAGSDGNVNFWNINNQTQNASFSTGNLFAFDKVDTDVYAVSDSFNDVVKFFDSSGNQISSGSISLRNERSAVGNKGFFVVFGDSEVSFNQNASKLDSLSKTSSSEANEDTLKLFDERMLSAGSNEIYFTEIDTNGSLTRNKLTNYPGDQAYSFDQKTNGEVVYQAQDSNNNTYVRLFNTSSGLSGSKTLTGIDTKLDSNELLIDGSTSASVTANFDDGSSSDVTSDATITSNDTNIATVSGDTVTAQGFGSTTIQADYQGETDTAPLDVKNATLDINYAKNVSATSAGFNGDLNTSGGITDADLGFVARRTDNNNVGDVFYSETQVNPNNLNLPFNYDGSLPQLSEGVEYEARAILRDADANTFESDDKIIFTTNQKVDIETLPTQQSDDDGAVVRGRINDVNDASIDELELYFQIRETGTTSFDLQILVGTIQVDNVQFPITRENDVSILDSSTQFEYQFGAIDST